MLEAGVMFKSCASLTQPSGQFAPWIRVSVFYDACVCFVSAKCVCVWKQNLFICIIAVMLYFCLLLLNAKNPNCSSGNCFQMRRMLPVNSPNSSFLGWLLLFFCWETVFIRSSSSSSSIIYFLLWIPAAESVLHIRTVLNQRQRIPGRSITVWPCEFKVKRRVNHNASLCWQLTLDAHCHFCNLLTMKKSQR